MKNWKVTTKDGQKGIMLRTIDREYHELPSTAYGAEVEHDHDKNPIKVTLAEDRFLPFGKVGARVAAKRLYTVKGEKPDGTVIQIPLENQINNNVASPENAIGLQMYQRRGINVLFDFETGEAAFCPTWDCWAPWNGKLNGFCSEEHKAITKPDPGNSPFGSQVTTTRSWS